MLTANSDCIGVIFTGCAGRCKLEGYSSVHNSFVSVRTKRRYAVPLGTMIDCCGWADGGGGNVKMAECFAETNGQGLVSPRKRPRRDDMSKVTVVLGAQWGDEGKGKVVDMLAKDADIVCRCQVRC